MGRLSALKVAALAGMTLLAACVPAATKQEPDAAATPRFLTPPGASVVWAVGDLCTDTVVPRCGQVGTLIHDDPDTTALLALGDLQYNSGALSAFQNVYNPNVGSGKGLRSKTQPTPGNHEYYTAGASGYYTFWGARAGTTGKGWHSFATNGWRIIATNSNCSKVGGCSGSSEQATYLRSRLSWSEPCEIVFDHYPAFSDGPHGDLPDGRALFNIAYQKHAELFLSGHEHGYQRFAPRTDTGEISPTGVRQVVVGTGGADLYSFATADRTEFRDDTHIGALRLTLLPGSYTGQFITVDGQVLDTFSGTCNP